MTKTKRASRKEVSLASQSDAVQEALEESTPDEPTVDDDTPLSFDSPESSSIAGAVYTPEHMTLVVMFRHGKKYGYGNISLAQWLEFYNASSKGEHFNKQIRPLMAGREL